MPCDDPDESTVEAPSTLARSASAARTNAVACPHLWLIRQGAGLVACPCAVPLLVVLLAALGLSNAWLYGYEYASTSLEYVGGAFMGLGIMPSAYLAMSLRALTRPNDGALAKLGLGTTMISEAAKRRLELLHGLLVAVSLLCMCVLGPWIMLQPLFMASPPMLPEESEWTAVTTVDNEITGLVLVVWPTVACAWILSENVAATLAADAVEEVIHPIKDTSIGPSNPQWAAKVEAPAVALVNDTMEDLSCWGAGLVAAVVTCLILAFSQFVLFLASDGATTYSYTHLGLGEHSSLRLHGCVCLRV